MYPRIILNFYVDDKNTLLEAAQAEQLKISMSWHKNGMENYTNKSTMWTKLLQLDFCSNKTLVSVNTATQMAKGLLHSLRSTTLLRSPRIKHPESRPIPMAQINWLVIVSIFSLLWKGQQFCRRYATTWLDEIIKMAEDMCATLLVIGTYKRNGCEIF